MKPKPVKKKARPRPRPRGRPSLYTKKLAAEICARVARGEFLSDICRDEKMPVAWTVHSWVVDDRKEKKGDASEFGFSQLYARAQDEDCDRRLKEIEEIADRPVEFSQTVVRSIGGELGKPGKMIKEVRKGDSVEHRRLQISTKQWLAIRQHRKRLAMGREAERQLEDDAAAGGDGTLHVVIEGGLADRPRVDPARMDPFVDGPAPDEDLT